jgi:acetate kinase
VINSGSSPRKYQRIDPPPGHGGGSGLIKRIGEPERYATHNYAGSTTAFAALITDHGSAVRIMQEWFDDAGSPLAAG